MPRIKITDLNATPAALTENDLKRIKGGLLGDGSVRFLSSGIAWGDGSVRNLSGGINATLGDGSVRTV